MKNTSKTIDLGERGKYNLNNKLNELTGKEWIKFTKSWFVHNPPGRKKNELLHPAKYPETLVKEFIQFFTKAGEWVLDPFLGTGSTLVAAAELDRNAAGIEITENYHKVSLQRINELKSKSRLIAIKGSSFNLKNLLSEEKIGDVLFDYIITSPPYWNQLERNTLRQKGRTEKGLATKYSSLVDDIGNEKNYDDFIELQAKIFDEVFDITRNMAYLTIITNNVFSGGKVYPLAFDTATSLTKRGEKSWTLKDEKIWLQNDKPLIALGVNSAWVGNRHHQYCLIFRKEIK